MTVIHLPIADQVEQCYREHRPGQENWLRWAKHMRARGRQAEIVGGLPRYRKQAA